MTTFLMLTFVAVAILLTLVVLVQRGRGGGLSGAFGSGGGSSSAFGTKTGDVFTWATVVLFAVFMLLAIWLNLRFPTVKEDYGSAVLPKSTTQPGSLETGQPAGTGTAPAVSMTQPAPGASPATSTSQPK